MHELATGPERVRRDLFRETAARMRVSEAIIEKDFWVCWVLDGLFSSPTWKEKLIFKGGTSLSKVFHAIKRFSEDIDLVLDWRELGYSKDDPWADRSKTQTGNFIKKTEAENHQYLETVFKPSFSTELQDRFGMTLGMEVEGEVVNITYPKAFNDAAILPQIKLEIGPLASWTPHESYTIKPYASEQFPHMFKESTVSLKAVTAERTFWEKATILHKEAHRGATAPQPQRYSRHYYDLYRLSQMPVKANALGKPELLADVVEFKQKFYPSAWANLETAVPGTLRLLPSYTHLDAIRKDYKDMESMLFDDPIPTFDEILAGLKALEDDINRVVV